MRLNKNQRRQWVLATALAAATTQALAAPTTYDGITFPDGDISFADSVIRYLPAFSGGNVPTDTNYTDPLEALGAPDYSTPNGSVSLGSGGLLELLFTDNSLTNSGDSDDDLHIFEIGPDVENTFVYVRPTASTLALLSGSFTLDDGFISVGEVSGSTSSIDIDFTFTGFAASALTFDAVRLIDNPAEGNTGGATVGADIDAVGAIFSAPPPPPDNTVPAPASLPLLLLGLLGVTAARRTRRRR
jgi:hypothetical protein